eukprot:gene11098-2212_t
MVTRWEVAGAQTLPAPVRVNGYRTPDTAADTQWDTPGGVNATRIFAGASCAAGEEGADYPE